MKILKLTMLVLAILSIVVGVSLIGYLNLDFVLTQENLNLTAGVINIIAGIWLGISVIKHWSEVY